MLHLTLLLAGAAAQPISQETPRYDVTPTVSLLREDFESDDPFVRRDVVEFLAQDGCEEAIALFLEALGDPDGLVADTAQVLLPTLEPYGVLGPATGKEALRSKDPRVAERVIEALGRFEGPFNDRGDLPWLTYTLRSGSPRAVRAGLWTIERLAQKGALAGLEEPLVKKVRRLTGGRHSDPVRAAALLALAALDEEAGVALARNLEDAPAPETACAALNVLSRAKVTGFTGLLSRRLGSPLPAVRICAADLIAELGATRATMGRLAERLRAEPRRAVRWRVVSAMRWLSGFKPGDDPDAWDEAVTGLAADWTSEDTTNAYRERNQWRGGFSVIERIEPHSDRVAILVDTSESLERKVQGGASVGQLLVPELGKLLSRIDQTGELILVPFAEAPRPQSEGLVSSDPEAIREYQLHLADATLGSSGGSSHLFAAFDHVLAIPDVDRIIVFTASSRFTGIHGEIDLMMALLKERLRFRPAVVDFVAIDLKPRIAARLEALASATSGRFVTVAAQ